MSGSLNSFSYFVRSVAGVLDRTNQIYAQHLNYFAPLKSPLDVLRHIAFAVRKSAPFV